MTTIVWFRQDLRLADNAAFAEAARRGPVVPVFILDRANTDVRAPGAASLWWLHHSLSALGERLGGLTLRRGDPAQILPALAREIGAGLVIPCHYDMFEFNTASPDEFIRVAEELNQPYRVLRAGERWTSSQC